MDQNARHCAPARAIGTTAGLPQRLNASASGRLSVGTISTATLLGAVASE